MPQSQLSHPGRPLPRSLADQQSASPPSEIPKHLQTSDLWKNAAGYLGAAIITLAVLIVAMQLWKADPTIPLRYTIGGRDNTFYLLLIKSIQEKGWFLDNDRVGAPDGLNMRDFPMPDMLHFGTIKLLTYAFTDLAVVSNLFYVLPFPLTALTAYFTMRRFKVGRLAALVVGVLYACAPYHFCRMIEHTLLAAYYLLPLTTWLLVRIVQGRSPLLQRDLASGKSRWRLGNWPTAGAMVVCALTGIVGVYYAFFTCFFLAAAGVQASVRSRQWSQLCAAAVFIVVICSVCGAALLPCFVYRVQNGQNREAAWRSPAEADIYGLNISEMLLPIEGHRLHSLDRLRSKYFVALRTSGEEARVCSPLGFVASVGFLWLVARFLWRRADQDRRVEDALGYLTIAGLTLASIGCLGASFNFYVTPMIRCYNRISIYMAFFALAALFVMLERRVSRSLKNRWVGPAYAVGLCMVLLFGLLDQTSKQYIPNYVEAKRQYYSDADFGRRMEEALPLGSMVYQLPFFPFPEGGASINNLWDYDLFRPYLHTRSLRWSYGVMKGRPAGRRQAEFAERPLADALPELAKAGFRGVYLDRAGYADNGAAVEAELSRLLGVEPQVSQTGRQVFFDMTQYAVTNGRLTQSTP